MIDKKNPIIIKDFNKGIADSPLNGFADMRNVDIDSIKGIAKTGHPVLPYIPPHFADQTFTADYTTDIITFADHNYSFTSNDNSIFGTGIAIEFSSTTALPNGLAVDTTYFLINVNSTNKQYKVATTYANAIDGTEIDITSNGTGTHTASTITLDTPLYGTVASNGDKYIADGDGNCWTVESQAEFLVGNEENDTDGLVVWKDFLFHFNGTGIDVLNLSTRTWTNSWKTITSSTLHNRAIVGRDDRVYFCNKHTIGSLLEVEGETFDPADTDTYTYNASALEIPDSDDTKWIAELGSNLMIATNRGRIYPWDRTSESFDAPLQMTEDIDVMIDSNNLLYVAGGTKGNIYVTDGTSVKKVAQLPNYLNDTAIYFNDVTKTSSEIVFAVENREIDGSAFGGVWSLDINTNILFLKNLVSGDDGYEDSSINVILSANTSDSFYVGHGYQEDAMIDIYASTRYYESYETYITSQYYTVGTKLFPRTFQTLEVEFTENLGSTDGFKVYYRVNLSDDWTQICAETGDATKTTKLFEYPMPTASVENIQFKITMKALNSANSVHTPLKEIRIT